MKKITGLISTTVLMFVLVSTMIPGVSVKAEDLYFTVQPQSVTAYTDEFTLTWETASTTTTAEVSGSDFGSYELGYTEVDTLPITVTNTGDNDLTNWYIKLESDECFELITDGEPADLAPGESNTTTYSIKPKTGFGVETYSVYYVLHSSNLETGVVGQVLFAVTENGAELTYEMSVNDVDFGTLEYDYKTSEHKYITISSVGTGSLTNVKLKLGDGDKFFDVTADNLYLDQIAAGSNSGENWKVNLVSGLEPGTYETQIEALADELTEPVLVTIKVVIKEEGAFYESTETTTESTETTTESTETTTESNETTTESNETTQNEDTTQDDSGKDTGETTASDNQTETTQDLQGETTAVGDQSTTTQDIQEETTAFANNTTIKLGVKKYLALIIVIVLLTAAIAAALFVIIKKEMAKDPTNKDGKDSDKTSDDTPKSKRK